MFQTFEQAQKYVRDYGVEMVDLKFCDLWGRWHHLTIPAGQFEPEIMEKGIGFDGSAVGLKSVKAGDMVLVPDLGTGFMDPFWDTATLSFICATLEADTHAIFQNDPRNIAIRAEEYMKSTGIADESRWGPEFEFYIFSKVRFDTRTSSSFYEVEHAEEFYKNAYHAANPFDLYDDFRDDACRVLKQFEGSLRPLVQLTPGHPWTSLVDTLAVLFLVVGTLACLLFFLFSVEHKGGLGRVAYFGRLCIMAGFGASFGYTVMARVSLLIGRVQARMATWLNPWAEDDRSSYQIVQSLIALASGDRI
ncbi:MAG: hypothetical protein HGA82_03910 [Anaerolineales bacterium]|nr:hypothetical protein [Anaerolineales bacterium]